MQIIDLNAIDASLIADIGDTLGDFVGYEAAYEDATVSNQCWHIVFSANHQRGGIVFSGSGSSGATSWTDATSADDVFARFLADEMAH